MSRTLIVLLAGLSAGLAHASPDAKSSKAPEGKQADKAAAESHKTLAELFPDVKKPELWIGSKAPALQLAHFPRGEAITSFEPGQTYVVEFWATWCLPCIAAFPHVAGLQKEHGDKVRVIGVNIWEQTSGDERVEMVNKFVEKHTEMQYTVAIEDGTSMSETWMRPAGQNFIPAAFIVNGQGEIAWMGDPMSMDEPLSKIIAGEYDIKAGAKETWNRQLAMTAFTDLRKAAMGENWDRMYDISYALTNEAFQDEPSGLKAVAWMLLQAEGAPEKCTKLAYKVAKTGCEKTDWEEWMLLDTYALAAFRNGNKEEAVKWQTKAIELAPDEAKPEMQAQLASFTAEG